jgi:hypothetical protein
MTADKPRKLCRISSKKNIEAIGLGKVGIGFPPEPEKLLERPTQRAGLFA